MTIGRLLYFFAKTYKFFKCCGLTSASNVRLFFIKCLNQSKIEFEQIIYKRKVWVFKNITSEKIKIFKSLWQKN